MLSDILSMIWNGISSCWSWFLSAYRAYGLQFTTLFLAVIVVSALGRYIIQPFVGGAASDIVSKYEKDRSRSKGK